MKVLFPKFSSEWVANKTYINDLFFSLELVLLIKLIYFVGCLLDVTLSKYCLRIILAP